MAQENEEPTDFSFESEITKTDLLELSKYNADLDKQCFWIPNQAFSNGITFKEDGPFKAKKFGVDYEFPSFTDYIQWSGVWEELEKAVSYSYLFGISIVVCLNDEDITSWKGKTYFGPTDNPATHIKAFYPVVNGSGYWVHQYDDDGDPEIYKIEITNKNYEIEYTEDVKEAKTVYYVHASRVVRFPCIQKDLSYPGTPKSYLTAHMAKAKQIYIESVVNAIKNQSAGTVIRRVANEEEMQMLEETNTTPSYKNRLYVMGVDEKIDELMQIFVPDFKSAQFATFTREINKYLASSSHISLRLYGEEDIATGIGEAGSTFSTNIIRGEVLDLQSRYLRPVEHVFFLLGKEKTEFEWNTLVQFHKDLEEGIDESEENIPDEQNGELKQDE